MRQAKAEAEREIASYRAEREGAYQKKIAEVRCCSIMCCWGEFVICWVAWDVGGPLCHPITTHVCILMSTHLQSSTGTQATMQRLNNETAVAIQKLQADVKAKKHLVGDRIGDL